ncbi:unnamed protein product [Rotaria sp. Silwood1]|nr:unnamed protein product [Rotaria sp. Silwood1]CAF3369653.1 unnamed protein product [Rotaria sp. Silwood1]CAF3373870.1 unnamed protein product [Rotaria sp. Silwood1]CAF4882935.1 unnamed protein product [Rotaria sp. Silwood1]CAF5036155.1 unnamed protein product [Rotaria sp. Silwood1]
MFRSSFFTLVIIIILMTLFVNGKTINNRRLKLLSTRNPISIKICGRSLIRLLDMVCNRARQLLVRSEISSSLSPLKRRFKIEDDSHLRTISITEYTQFNDTLIDECCLQACSLKTLLKYC